MGAVPETMHRTATVLSSTIGGVFNDLEKIAGTVSAVASSTIGVPKRVAFQFLKPEFADLIKRHSDVIIGAGIAYAPGSLPEARHWLEWWRGSPGEARFVTHDLNPSSLNYYDYAGREWFTGPSASGTPVAVGPYVDFGGINVNIITLSVPAATPQGTHVLGGDLTLAKVEGVFLQALHLHEPSVILLGPNGRVIASNDARIASGTLLRDEDTRRVDYSVAVSPTNPTRLPWKLVSLRE